MKAFTHRQRASKIPIQHRSFLLPLLLLLLLLPVDVLAASLTEKEVTRLARLQDPDARVAKQLARLATAEESIGNLAPNPELSWEREHLPSTASLPSEREDTVALSVPLQLGGQRSAQRALARARSATARAAAIRARSAAVARALMAFYEAIAARERAAIAQRHVGRLVAATRIVERRQEAGDASGLERTRLELETQLAKSDLRQEQARANLARSQLLLLLNLPPGKQLRLAGTLETHPPKPPPTQAELATRGTVRESRRATAEARAAGASAGRGWLPDLTLMGGLKIDHAQQTRYGYVAGVSVTLPIFSRGQDLHAAAAAEQGLAQARERRERRALRAAILQAHLQLIHARRELEQMRRVPSTQLARLERSAQRAYQAGERSLLELLDIQRARITLELRVLSLALRAKQAEVALRQARGDFE